MQGRKNYTEKLFLSFRLSDRDSKGQPLQKAPRNARPEFYLQGYEGTIWQVQVTPR